MLGGDLQPDPRAALGFYGPLLGWELADPGPMPGDLPRSTSSRLGGTVIAPPKDTPGFRSAVLADPQGAVFSISQLTAGP